MSTETTTLPNTALLLMARAGLDLDVFDAESKRAENVQSRDGEAA